MPQLAVALLRKRLAWCGALACTAGFLSLLAMNSTAVPLMERGGWIPISSVDHNDIEIPPAIPPPIVTFRNLVRHSGMTVGVFAFRYSTVTSSRGQASTTSRLLLHCQLIMIEKDPERAKPRVLSQLSLRYPVVEKVGFEAMLSLVQDCERLQDDDKVDDERGTLLQLEDDGDNKSLSLFTLMSGIVPGTKWCGINDIADNYHDLGQDFRVDKCCRAHDHCPVKIKAFSSNYGATNYHVYTKSHCACDDLFYKCLKDADASGSRRARAIGNLFFNVLSLQCAAPTYPKICVEGVGQTVGRAVGQTVGQGVGQQEVNGTRGLLEIRRRRGRLFFGSGNRREDRCARWAEDLKARPTLKFSKPKRLF